MITGMNNGYYPPRRQGSGLSVAGAVAICLVVLVVVLALLQMYFEVDIVQGVQDVFDELVTALSGTIIAPNIL